MDLLSSTWMTRSLGESASALYLEQDDGSLFAGGWDGRLKYWDARRGARLDSLITRQNYSSKGP